MAGEGERRNVNAEIEYAARLEEDARELYEHAPAGYVSSLPGGTIVKVNETFLAWTGFAREDLVGAKRFFELLPPGGRIYWETHYAPLLQMQGSVREIASEIVRADGTRLPVLLNSTLIRDESGAPRIVRTTVFDASDRRRYEQELLRARADAESRARASLALEHVNEGILLVSADDRVDLLNAAAEAILRVSAEEVVGRRVDEALPHWATLAPRVPVGDRTRRVAPATLPLVVGGRELWLSVAGGDSGDGVVYTMRDVTDDRRLEQLRNDLVAIVSHELRTPLTGVYGAATTLLGRDDELDDERRRALLRMIVAEGERLTRIVDQILLTSNIDTGNISVEGDDVDVGAVIASVVGRAPAAARVAVSAEDGLRAHADAGKLEQVLANLVDNALKYSDGLVRVAARAAGSRVRLEVVDEGPGIPAADRERVFEKFYRLDPSQAGGVGGTGLGLYIARELVQRMRGRIELEPTGPGTTMVVTLPRSR